MKAFPRILLLALHVGLLAAVTRADDQVVTDFGDNGGPNQLRAKLQALEDSGGGTLTFSGGPATIVLAQGVLPSIATDTTIDGGDNIAISGNNASRIFFVSAGATLTLNNLTITNAYSNADDGGAIRNDGPLVINNCHFMKNRADGWSGGAIESFAPLTIVDSEFANNTAANGGALFPRYGPAVTTISGSSFHDNSTDAVQNAGGGAIFVFDGAPVTITDSDFSSNVAYNGGAIHSSFANNMVTLQRTKLTGNKATDRGGGIYNKLATVGLTDVTFSGNIVLGKPFVSPGAGGGGLYNESGTATVEKSTFSENGGNNSTDGGGMINANGQATLTNVTFSKNVSGYRSGGLFNEAATGVLTNVTFYGNRAGGKRANGGGGGGICNINFMGTPHLRLKNVVLQANTEGGGNAGNCAFPQNAPADSAEFSLSSDSTCGFGAGRDGVDPQLRVLADYGGFTQTHAPEPTSPVIDAGTGNGAPETDQRGVKRPQGFAIDIGAVELENNQLPGCNDVNTVVSNTDDSGDGSLRDVMANVCGGSTITFADTVQGEINLTTGELAINKALTINGPGANLLTVQRSFDDGTPDFRIFDITGNFVVAISGLTISNGNVPGALDFGGGIYNQSGALTLVNCAVSDNAAGFSGGGISSAGTLVMDNCTISGNSARFSGGIGGGKVTMTNCTISGNTADNNAGGISIGPGTSITNSTITGNSAGERGGGVFNNGAGGDSIEGRNTIIALNTAPNGPDISGPFISQGFNLIGDDADAAITPAQDSDQIGVSADELQLGPLQDNGGPTRTHALLAGSVAIDQGDSSGAATDQRGLSRPVDVDGIDNVDGGDGADIGAFEALLTEATPAAFASQLLNLSTRKQVGTGDNVLIGGFIVVGTENKKILMRGLGPSLPVNGALADPILELHDATSALLAVNDNWREKQGEILATGIPPANDLESAIVATLVAKPLSEGGAGYTGVLAGKGGTSGIGVLEIYDLAVSANSKLANISTRGLVGIGDDVLIGGFIPGPSDRAAVKVLVRAIGPSLTAAGVSGALQDPVLELHDSNGNTLALNDNWKDSQQADIEATGIPPSDAHESAIVSTLAPSNSGYTAIVRGVNNTTGVGLVEVYALD